MENAIFAYIIHYKIIVGMSNKNKVAIGIFYLLTTVSVFSHQCHYSQASGKEPTYRLIWQENFDSKVLDTTQWSRIKRGVPAWRRHMSTHERLYDLKHGRIRLYCLRNTGWLKGDTARVVTGGITTEGKRHFSGYGKIEVKARISGAQGCWPAIWMTSVKYMNDPAWAEIDIMEYYNHDNHVVQTAHNTYASVQKKQKENEHSVHSSVNPKKWNVYGVEILPDKLVFTLNGFPTYTYPKVKGKNIEYQFPYGVESFLRIDMQWGNSWLRTDEADLPAHMDIDWVKYYRMES